VRKANKYKSIFVLKLFALITKGLLWHH
jgi:hypothetical protein